MEKILVEVSVPAIEERYDVFIPPLVTMGELAAILAKAVENLSDGRYAASGEEIVYPAGGNGCFPPQAKVSRCAVKHGDRLVLQ